MVRWHRRKGGTQQAGTADLSHTQPTMINLTPASYAGAAAAATDLLQTRANPNPTHALPAITEVTVLCQGGHINSLTEQQIQVCPPDAIIQEVKLKMVKTLLNPIPLKDGRWSIQPCSKGNFIYSFNGHIPFDIISSYEHILLEPFHSSGQLCPSLGWT